MAEIWVEEAKAVVGRPRCILASNFCEWIMIHDRLAKELPQREIVVEIMNSEFIPKRFSPSATAVGVYLVSERGVLSDEYRILVAYGQEYVDASDVEAWLTTVAHHLLYIIESVKENGDKTPKEIGPAYYLSGAQHLLADARENEARELVTTFASLYPDEFKNPDLLQGVKRKKLVEIPQL